MKAVTTGSTEKCSRCNKVYHFSDGGMLENNVFCCEGCMTHAESNRANKRNFVSWKRPILQSATSLA